jgi:hypothetical protein
MSRITAVAVALMLSACASGPKSWTGAPPISGFLHASGTPLQGTKVRLVNGLDNRERPSADARVLEVSSNAEGKFRLGPIGKKSHLVRISPFGLGESIADWGIQFQHEGQWVTGWSSSKSFGYAPRDLVLVDCDITRVPIDGKIEGTSYGTDGEGFCRLTLSTEGNR